MFYAGAGGATIIVGEGDDLLENRCKFRNRAMVIVRGFL